MKVKLTTIQLGRLGQGGETPTVEVSVNEHGKFSAEFVGETFEADSLDGLSRMLRTAFEAARFEVPFVTMKGERGVIRGYHSGNRDLLVTMSDGSKGRMDNYSKIFRPESVTDSEIDEMRALEREIERRQVRLGEIRQKGERASDVFNESFGADVTDHKYDPDAVQEVAPA